MLIGPHATQAASARSSRAQHHGAGRATTSPSRRWRSPPARPWSSSGIAPRHVDLRPFVLSGKEIRIVPGGLTRVALKRWLAGGEFLAGRRHQGHLDPGGRGTGRVASPVPVAKGRLMLSRTADNLFWLARYIERAEQRGARPRRRLTAWRRCPPGWATRSATNGARCSSPPAARRASTRSTRRRTPNRSSDWLVFDPDNSSSILSCFETARRNARAVRTALTVDMWEALNDTWTHLRNLAPRRDRGRAAAELPGLGAGARHAVQRRGA